LAAAALAPATPPAVAAATVTKSAATVTKASAGVGKAPAAAYIANLGSGTVTRIDTATNRLEAPVRLGPRSGPIAVAVTPDGKTAYVASIESSTVTPVSTSTGRPGRPIRVPRAPDHLAVTPDGKTLYVASQVNGNADEPGWVTPIATATNRAGRPVRVGIDPGPIVIGPRGTSIYVLTSGFRPRSGGGNVTVITTATDTIRKVIRLPQGSSPVDLAVTPDGRTLYVASQAGPSALIPVPADTLRPGKPIGISGNPQLLTMAPDGSAVYVLASNGEVTRVSTRTDRASWSVLLYGELDDLAIGPNGHTLFVLSNMAGYAPGFVRLLNAVTGRLGRRVQVCRAAELVAVTPGGRGAYAVCSPLRGFNGQGGLGVGTVVPVSTATGRAGRAISVGRGPIAIAVAP
jgi:YVTN family beta-propeller protein